MFGIVRLELKKIVLIYDSKTGNTDKMAQAIADGIRTVKDLDLTVRKVGEAFSLSFLEKTDAIIIGSPARYANVTSDMRVIFENILNLQKTKIVNLKGKLGAAFGSYGWDGGITLKYALEQIFKSLEIKLFSDVILSVETPSEKILDRCYELGKKICEKISKK